jgi:hypothetical protein
LNRFVAIKFAQGGFSQRLAREARDPAEKGRELQRNAKKWALCCQSTSATSIN